MTRNNFLKRLNPFSDRTNHPANRHRRSLAPRRRLFLEGLEQRTLLAVLTVTSPDDITADDDVMTLREAIVAANADSDTDTIVFDIGGGPQTITLGEEYLSITETITIDGPTDVDGKPLITIDAGAVTDWAVMGLSGGAGGSELRNFQISNGKTALVFAPEAGDNVVENLLLSGTGTGVYIMSDGNEIRGAKASMSANGVFIYEANWNTVESCDLRNSRFGVHLQGNANNNLIQHNNLVQHDNASASQNGVKGYVLTGTGNRVIGNDFSNTSTGIAVSYGEYAANHIEELLVVRGNVFTGAATALTLVDLRDIDLVAGSDFDIDVRDATTGITLLGASNVTIDGFDLSGDPARSDDTGLRVRGSVTNATSMNVTIKNIVVRDRGTGIVVNDTSNATASCSRILNNGVGVAVSGGATTGLILNNNQIQGNTLYGISNATGSLVNAEYNYWGAGDGPSHLSNPGGSGDSYSGNVAADHFLAEIPPCIDTTPPEILGVDVSTDFSALIVQLNDDDLDLTLAQDRANYQLTAAGVDRVFGTADDRDVVVDSIVYDAATDVITVRTSEPLYEEVFRIAIDGDGEEDGTPGVTDVAGNFLAGGDFTAVLDMTTLTLLEDLVMKVEVMGLSTGSERSLVGRLEGAVKALGAESNGNGVLAIMEAFKRGVVHHFDRGLLTIAQRDELLDDVDLIILGITLTNA